MMSWYIGHLAQSCPSPFFGSVAQFPPKADPPWAEVRLFVDI